MDYVLEKKISSNPLPCLLTILIIPVLVGLLVRVILILGSKIVSNMGHSRPSSDYSKSFGSRLGNILTRTIVDTNYLSAFTSENVKAPADTNNVIINPTKIISI